MDFDVRSAFFFKSQFFVIKDFTVDALKNAFAEHVLKEKINKKYCKLSYPYLHQSSSMIKPFCLHQGSNKVYGITDYYNEGKVKQTIFPETSCTRSRQQQLSTW